MPTADQLQPPVPNRLEPIYRNAFMAINQGFSLLDIQFDGQGQAYDVIIRDANPAQNRIDGLQALIGKRVKEYLPDFERKWIERYAQVARSGESAQFEDWSQATQRWYEVDACSVGGAGSSLVAIIYNDITHRKKIEDALQQSQELNAFLLQLSDGLRSLADPVEIEATAARQLGQYLDANQVHYGETIGDDVLIHRGYGNGLPPMVGRFHSVDFGDKLTATHRAGLVQVVADVETNPSNTEAERQVLRAAHIGAYITVPLIKKGEWVATLAVHSIDPRPWTSQQVESVKETAERTWAAVERARAEAALKEADQRKDEFLAMLAHELRNPLATIANTLQVLDLTKGAEAILSYDKAVQMMNREARHLNRMVDDLLDVSRIRQGKIKLERKRIDLSQLVEQTVEAAQLLYHNHNRHLALQLPSSPLYVQGDATRLTQVIMNLLTNGAKYTLEGGHVWVSLEAVERNVLLRVKDDGMGIPRDELRAIFETFVQGNTSLDRPQGGLGLGLAVVKQLVAGHQGTIDVVSEGTGQGSEFLVELPLLTEASTPAQTGRDKPRPAPSSNVGRILVVDDNTDLADLTAKLIQLKGYEVHTRYSGPEALEAAEALAPDAILLDIGMPYLDGYAVCQTIRVQPWGQSMAIIAITGYGQEADKQRSRAAGFNDHLLKPIDYPLLMETLAHYMVP